MWVLVSWAVQTGFMAWGLFLLRVGMTLLISPAHGEVSPALREGSCSRGEVLKTRQCSEPKRLRNQRTGWKFQALDDFTEDM